MSNKMRFRNGYVIFGTILVVVLFLISDPDSNLIQNLPFGSATIDTLLQILKAVIKCSLLYITRKAMMDYVEADFQVLGQRARNEPVAAAIYAIAVALMTIAFAMVISSV